MCQARRVPDHVSLSLHGREMNSVFSLLGSDENDLTAALGWTLAHSPRLLQVLTAELSPRPTEPTIMIDLEVTDGAARTDLELHGADHGVIVEAKRGWQLPTVEQLALYASRLKGIPVAHLLTLSDCSPEWTKLQLPSSVEGITVTHLPWSHVMRHLATARRGTGGHERVWLDQLETFLKEALRMIAVNNAEVYCVVLSHARPGDGGPHTYREVVEQGFYYYPYGWGHGWPPIPPNFLAFRWENQVQRVHRVIDYEVIPTLQDRWPDIPPIDDTDRPHLLCRLGPALRMDPLPTGINYRANRIWVLLDQLFTARTLQEAYLSSQRLRGEVSTQAASAGEPTAPS